MKLLHAIAFFFIYLRELLLSTFRIARLVVHPHVQLSPKFAELHLDLKGEFPRLLFVCLVSMTPGSLSVALDRKRSILIVHLLDCHDPVREIAGIKTRLEKPLRQIFGQL